MLKQCTCSKCISYDFFLKINLLTAKVIPKDLAEFDTLELKMRVIPTFKKRPWDNYELETLVKVYNIVRFVKDVHGHNEHTFWNKVSQRLYRLGIYRDAQCCKDKVRAHTDPKPITPVPF